MNARCPGCGARFQHDEPDKPGYLPPELMKPDGVVCRRCYRLSHYGRAAGRPLTPAEARRWIGKALDAVEAAVVVTEIGDFEGSLPPPGLLPADKPVILVVNKIDLLPPKSVVQEVMDWARSRWRTAGLGRPASAVVAVSAARGTGLPYLFPLMRRFAGPRRALAVVGATSVGKSTLMRRLLAGAGAAPTPTVSRFPGTTQAAMSWRLERDGLTIYDTPGFLPGDRLTDLLCPDCAAKLVTEHALTSKLFGLEPGQALVFGGFAAFVLQGTEPRTFLAYAADQVVLHRTGAVKAEELLSARPDWLLPWACARCRPARTRQEREFDLAVNEDLAVAGLGWISLRGGPARIRVLWPEGARLVHRQAMFARRSAPRRPAGSAPGPPA